jgi:purine-binding chemotaxis protein CheW
LKEGEAVGISNSAIPTGGGIDGSCMGRAHVLQLVSFRIGDEIFALDILRVREIIRMQELTRVPNSPAFVDGVINLRGTVIPVIALRQRFGLGALADDNQTRIVVVENKGTVLGFIVDSVSEVLRIPADTVKPPLHLGHVVHEYVSGLGKLEDRLLIVLDADLLMSDAKDR